jgi:hypothetical protein
VPIQAVGALLKHPAFLVVAGGDESKVTGAYTTLVAAQVVNL